MYTPFSLACLSEDHARYVGCDLFIYLKALSVQFSSEQYMDSAAAAVDLEIAVSTRADVITSLNRIAELAEQLMDFPLTADIGLPTVSAL